MGKNGAWGKDTEMNISVGHVVRHGSQVNLYVTNVYISRIGCCGNDSEVGGDIRTNHGM